MIEFRLATIEDVDALAIMRVRFLCERHDMPPEERELLRLNNAGYFAESLRDGSFLAWLAVEDGAIVATSGLTVYRLPPNGTNPSGITGYVSNMYTLPERRRQGLANRLFSMTMEAARARGCGKIVLYATRMGKPIYEKYGFEADEKGMRYFL